MSTNNNGIKLTQGNEACSLGALAAGADFYAGYPITPSSEIAEHMANKLPRLGGKFLQMEDEIASIGAIIGASIVGHKAFTATSGPGFSLMQELIGYAAMTELPIVIVNVMRGGPSTGLPTQVGQADLQQARWGTHGDHSIIAISPASVTETYYETINAFNLAEKYRTPVILLMDEVIGHLRERLDISEGEKIEIINRKQYSPAKDGDYLPYANTEDMVPPFSPMTKGPRWHVTGLTHGEKGFYSAQADAVESSINRLVNKIEANADDICRVNEFKIDDAEIVLVAYGSVARVAAEAVLQLREEGIKAGLIRPITVWPFPDKLINNALQNKKLGVVVELSTGQLGREIERVAPKDLDLKHLQHVNGKLIKPGTIIKAVKEAMS